MPVLRIVGHRPFKTGDGLGWNDRVVKRLLHRDAESPGAALVNAPVGDGVALGVIQDALGTRGFQLWLGKPGDFSLSAANRTGVRACKVAWRSDSRELAVVQSDDICLEDEGALVRLALSDPTRFTQFAAKGDDPAFQPMPTDG